MKLVFNGPVVSDGDYWIYSFFGVPAIAAKVVREALEKANGELIEIDINSPGGDVFSASEIYTVLKSYKNIKMRITGVAASAASVIACAGYCEMSPTAQMMVHNVSSVAAGNYHEMDKSSQMLKEANRAVAAAYVAKTGMSEAEALKLMDAETWLSAKSCLERGLVDAIMDGETEEKEPEKLVAAISTGMLPIELINNMQQKKAALEIELLNLEGVR